MKFPWIFSLNHQMFDSDPQTQTSEIPIIPFISLSYPPKVPYVPMNMSHILPWICHGFSRFFGGEVLLGEVPTVTPKLSKAFRTIMTWADEHLESWYFSFFFGKNHGKLGQIDDLFRKTWKCRSFWKRDECSRVWRRQNHGKRWTIDEKSGCSHVFAEKQWFVTLVADGHLSVFPEICCRWLVLKSISLSIIEEITVGIHWELGNTFFGYSGTLGPYFVQIIDSTCIYIFYVHDIPFRPLSGFGFFLGFRRFIFWCH